MIDLQWGIPQVLYIAEVGNFESWVSCKLQRLFKNTTLWEFFACFLVYLADFRMVWGCFAGTAWPKSPGLVSPVQLQANCPDSVRIRSSLHYTAVCSIGILWLLGLLLHFHAFLCILKPRKQWFQYYWDFFKNYFSTEVGGLRTANRVGGLRKLLFLFCYQTLYAFGLWMTLPLPRPHFSFLLLFSPSLCSSSSIFIFFSSFSPWYWLTMSSVCSTKGKPHVSSSFAVTTKDLKNPS